MKARPLTFWLGATGALAAAAALAWLLYDTLFPVFIGFGLAYAFDPVADRLEKRGVERTIAVSLIMAAVLGLSALALALLLPPLLSETREFARGFPQHLALAVDRAQNWADSWGVPLPHGRKEMLERVRAGASSASLSLLAPLGSYAGKFFSGAAGLMVGALNLVVIPVVFFYILRDITALRLAALGAFPPRHREWAAKHMEEADRVFSGYIRGQIAVALILAVIYSAGLAMVGIRFAVVIGALSGLLNVVPYLGVMTGVVLSLVMAAVDSTGLGAFLGIGAVFAAAQLLEGFVITPRMVGDRVGLTSLETIVSLIFGGELGGILGMVLAIPAAGCLKVYLKDAYQSYRRSEFYRG